MDTSQPAAPLTSTAAPASGGRFAGQRILITGGTSGIGLAGARRITREGGQVIITGSQPDRAAAAQRQLPEVRVVLNDAAAADTGTALTRAVAADDLSQPGQQPPAGGFDGLWLNAGYAALGELADIDAACFDHMMAANVRGPMLQMAALASHLRDGASVVITSSTSSREGAPATAVYAATKAALEAAARVWAAELAPRQIRVNVLVPGPIDTGFRDFLSPEARATFEAGVLEQVPLARAGTADEAAAVALFLLSNDAAYVTGSQYTVDGGQTRR